MQYYSRYSRTGRCEKVANQNPPLKWTISPFMHPRAPTSPPRGGAATALCRLILALLHLSMIATAHAARQTLAVPPAISQPYLATMGAPALRFGESAPTTPLIRKPIASGPPVAATGPEAAEVALANNHAAASTPPFPLPEADSIAPSPEKPRAEQTSTPKPKPILPDDTPKPVQSQDFLPLFRFPGSPVQGEDGTVMVPVVPVPPTMPASSATYTQH